MLNRQRFIALVLLALAGTSAHAAQDCWQTFRLRDYIGRGLGEFGTKSNIGTRCFATAAEVTAQVKSEATAAVNKTYTYPPDGSVTVVKITFGACGPGGWERHPYGWPTVACQYQVTETTTFPNRTFPPPPSVSTQNSEFAVALACGELLGTSWVTSVNSCRAIVSKTPKLASCPAVGNPIHPLDGLKSQSEAVLSWGRGHTFSATYAPLHQQLGERIEERGAESFGAVWFSNLHRAILVNYPTYLAQRGGGVIKRFINYGRTPASALEIDPPPVSLGSTLPARYFDATSGAEEEYQTRADSGAAQLKRITYIDGRSLNVEYIPHPDQAAFGRALALLSTVTDEAGRRLTFQYENVPDRWPSMRLSRVLDPAGRPYVFTYGEGNVLTSIVGPDLKGRKFEYDIPGRPLALTGTIDENDVKYGSYAYDPEGRATGTRNGTNGQSWQTAWPQPPRWTFSEYYDDTDKVVYRVIEPPLALQAEITGPDGRSIAMSSEVVAGTALLKSTTQPAGAGCAAATSLVDHDTEGNDVRRVDFNGGQSCHAYVQGRHLETARVEGLVAGASCSPLLAPNAALPTGSRKVNTQWHPDWRLATKTAEPRRITTMVYNGQPDPFNGNAIASCAPTEAKLSSGKPIVVLCKRVEQATTDETGALGFNATLQTGVPARAASWTYNATGQVLTETDALNRIVVTNEYYADTTTDYTKGDLKSTTNALNQKTSFLRYNAFGKPLETVDANALTTTYVYDLRERLTSVTSGGTTTSYEYFPTGLLKRSTQPDGSAVSYEYDDAHRLVAASDTRGNRIDFTLDQSGNRTGESAKDPNGTLRRTMSRAFDALGRAQQTTGRE